MKANEAYQSSDLEISKFVSVIVLLRLAYDRYIKDVLELEVILKTKQEVKDALCLNLFLSDVPVELKVKDSWQRLTQMQPREYGGAISPALRVVALGIRVVDALFVELPQNSRHLFI